MLESVRVRLTLWYAAALALVLAALAFTTYFILRGTMAQRADAAVVELGEAFLTTLQAELEDHSGASALRDSAQVALVEHRFREYAFAVLDPAGNIIASSRDLPVATSVSAKNDPSAIIDSPVFRDFTESAAGSDRFFQNLRGGEHGLRAYARHFSAQGQDCTLIVVHSLHSEQELLIEVERTFSLAIPIAVLLASVGGYFLARKSLAPVVAMSTQAGRIGATTLYERLPIKNEKDELGHLAKSFNLLLDRLSESFERQRRFMADASHELRTPAAILRGETEVALSRPQRSPDEYRESLEVLRTEAQRLTRIVEDLFTLARADAGQYPLAARDFYLDELVTDCARATRTLALPKNISLQCDTAQELPIHADEALLRRMILNLLDNAIKYTPNGGKVVLQCSRRNGEYVVSVTDTGPGIPADLQPRIFERFFRADRARSRAENDGGGAGLGLAIARWIAEAHCGSLQLSRSDSAGSTFAAVLPAQLNSPES